LRMFLMFIGPFKTGGDYREAGVSGMRRFIERVWRYAVERKFEEGPIEDQALLSEMHRKIKKATADIAEQRYNTAISAAMELLNALQSGKRHYRDCIKTLLQLLYPFAPFVTHEIWERLGEPQAIGDAPWPTYDEGQASEERIEIAIQINGKIRDRIKVGSEAAQSDVERVAFECPKIEEQLRDRQIGRIIYAQGRLLNIVCSEEKSIEESAES